MYGSDVPEPESVSRTKTYSNPLSLGAFHSIVAGVNSTDIENFSRGIRNLQFAGEYRFGHLYVRKSYVI